MDRIEYLTPEQSARFPEFVDKWTRIGLCTDRAERKKAEEAMTVAYATAGLPAPRFVWCDSPMSMALTRAIYLELLKKTKESGASVRASVWDSVRDSVRASVRDSVWDSVGASVGDSAGASVWDSMYGQHDANWLAFYEFFREVTGLSAETEKLSGLTALANSAGWAIPHEKVCWISERHEIVNQDELHRLHSVTGPAVRYPDGWSIYAVHGVRVPEFVIMNPEQITVQAVDAERNAEVRRVMLERFPGGLAAYLVGAGAKVVHRGNSRHKVKGLRGSRLLYREIPEDEPIVMIECRNSTPEPDGTTKLYHIRIDPSAYNGMASRDVHAAMASTWRKADGSLEFKDYREYLPAVET